MSLDKKIEAAVAKLMAGSDPAEVLREFAKKVKTVERIRKVKVCSGCGTEDALCFLCKAREVVGDKAVMTAPFLIPKLMTMAKEWAQEASEARARSKVEEAGGKPQEEFPGRQSF